MGGVHGVRYILKEGHQPMALIAHNQYKAKRDRLCRNN